jgi:flavorubredoxin
VQASVDHAELRAILGASKGIMIMCPDSDNVAVKQALDIAFSEMTPKKHKVAIAESFGGNDEPVDKLSSDLISLGLDPVFTLRVKQDPTEQVCHREVPGTFHACHEPCPQSPGGLRPPGADATPETVDEPVHNS